MRRAFFLAGTALLVGMTCAGPESVRAQTPDAAAAGPKSDWAVCADAGRQAEQRYAIPSGLLLAIGHVETGRSGPGGKVVAWPWSVDAMGASSYFADRRQAIDAVTALRTGKTNSIDVGCFQVNLYYHPEAFSSVEDAFDPYANAFYAARFLSELHARTGSWEGAVAQYHSAELKFGLPYRDRVLAEWGVLGAPPEKTVAFGVHVIGPPRPDNGPRVIAIR